jgi:hypothetical protein
MFLVFYYKYLGSDYRVGLDCNICVHEKNNVKYYCPPCRTLCPIGQDILGCNCINCETGKYKSLNDGSSCLNYGGGCIAGTYQTSACDNTRNRIFTPCPANTTNDVWNTCHTNFFCTAAARLQVWSWDRLPAHRPISCGFTHPLKAIHFLYGSRCGYSM